MDNTKVSIFQKDEWEKFLPEKLHLVTNNGDFKLERSEVIVMPDKLQVIYYQQTFEGPNDVNKDGEPDNIGFDIHMVKTNDGTQANPDNLKLNVDVTYGDAMVSQFTISKPGETTVAVYNGFESKFDSDTEFGFDDESINDLVSFFNRFGFKLDSKDFTFIDKYPNSYVHNESVKLMPSFNDDIILIINNSRPQENKFLPNLVNYLKNRGINHNIVSNKHEFEKNNNDKVIGCISSGSEYSLTNPGSPEEYEASEHAINTLSCPILGMCYGMQSMAKSNGINLTSLDKPYINNTSLSECDNSHPLFKGIDLTKDQVSFNFSDCLDGCPDGFKEIAKLDDKVAGIANDEKKHYGLLFHPEDMENTQVILDNFIEMCKGGVSNDDLQQIDNSQNNMKYIQTFEKFRIQRK